MIIKQYTPYIAFILLLSLAGCKDSSAPQNPKLGKPIEVEACPNPITPTMIGQGELSGLPRGQRVITNRTDWQDLLSKMPSYETNRFTETDIDFSLFTVVAAFDDRGYQDIIEIIGICEYADFVVVRVTLRLVMLPATSTPFHIVKIPKTDKPVVFKCVYDIKPAPRDSSCQNGGYVFTNTEKNHYYYGHKKIPLILDEACSKRYNAPCFKHKTHGEASILTLANSSAFLVELKRKEDVELLQKIAAQKHASISYQLKFMPLWYKVKMDKCALKSSLEVANEFYETGYFDAVDYEWSTYTRCDM